MRESEIDIQFCSACGDDHKGVPVTVSVTDPSIGTALCPKTGKELLVSGMTNDTHKPDPAFAQALDAFADASWADGHDYPNHHGQHGSSAEFEETKSALLTAHTTALARAREETQWQPIETAPKKNQLIDLWTGERRITGCWWDEICGEWRSMDHKNFIIRFKNATHWRPIPPPPQEGR